MIKKLKYSNSYPIINDCPMYLQAIASSYLLSKMPKQRNWRRLVLELQFFVHLLCRILLRFQRIPVWL